MRHARQWNAVLAATVFLSGCEVTPQPPGLLVVTDPPGATCLLTRQGQAFGATIATPAIANGIQTGGAGGVITVTCSRPGFADATVAVAPVGSEGGFFASSTPVYPTRIDIAMVPRGGVRTP